MKKFLNSETVTRPKSSSRETPERLQIKEYLSERRIKCRHLNTRIVAGEVRTSKGRPGDDENEPAVFGEERETPGIAAQFDTLSPSPDPFLSVQRGGRVKVVDRKRGFVPIPSTLLGLSHRPDFSLILHSDPARSVPAFEASNPRCLTGKAGFSHRPENPERYIPGGGGGINILSPLRITRMRGGGCRLRRPLVGEEAPTSVSVSTLHLPCFRPPLLDSLRDFAFGKGRISSCVTH
ncbi:hypothetical protein TNIN_431961 [Trichonephila inaurata madagascariensis]|uniref:Uncharacterized protein n=1 Tax=Trichonephila inaurata madagascariensis TaxID=2747483 RepID=A0A8X6XZ33_9ARAC|nr:hypothetical protein TNIN_431961 [Trichonephila inaurata madagascariensis]